MPSWKILGVQGGAQSPKIIEMLKCVIVHFQNNIFLNQYKYEKSLDQIFWGF